MVKVIGIIIAVLIAISGIYKSTTRHKIGYGLLVVWFIPIFSDSIHQQLWTYFETHKLVATIYDPYLILFLLVYGAIGILEGIIRLANDNFTFLGWISGLLKSKKEERILIESVINSTDSVSFKPEKQKEENVSANIIYPNKSSNLDTILFELNQMIGLKSVKREISELIQMEKYQQQREKQGLKNNDVGSYHLIFAGNPGTGKTTVARMVAGIYYHLGIVSRGQLIEVDRSGLVGEYVGQTAQKTTEVIKKAIGGVLFIDEAYSLIHEGAAQGDTFGKEALDTLLKAMEDYRDDLVIIMAGYTQEMENFISVNPGLKSRFKKTIHFEDYDPQELLEIFCSYACKDENIVLPETQTELAQVFSIMYEKRDQKFGNGRFVRNLYNAILQQLSVRVSRLKSPSKTELQTITPEDVRLAAEMELGTAVVNAKSFQLLDHCQEFELKSTFWDSDIEGKVYSALRNFISDEYIIIPHDAFSNIFKWEWEKDWKLTDRVTKMHYDFAIYDNDFHLIFLIEVNGKEHKKPNRVESDTFKAVMLEKVELKLLIIDASRTIANVQHEVEECIKKAFPARECCPTYCPDCHSWTPMILQTNSKTQDHYYRCNNKDCGKTHSLGKSGEYKKIAPLYRNMSDKVND